MIIIPSLAHKVLRSKFDRSWGISISHHDHTGDGCDLNTVR
jgi:hypothetical protein